MRVLIAADVVSVPATGVGLYTRTLIDVLKKSDEVEVTALVTSGSEREWGVPVISADLIIPGLPVALAREEKLKGFDVIHCPTVRVPFLRKPKGPKLVMTIHDLVPLVAPEHHTIGHRVYFRYFLRRSLRRFDGIIAVSESTKSDLTRLLSIDAEKISVVRSSIRWSIEEKNPSPDGKFFLAVGTLEPRKNLKRVIEAFVSFRRRHRGLGHRLLIAGPAGWGPRISPSLGAEFSGDVEWLGYVSEERLRELYRTATALVYPSLYEGFGLPPLEAMSHGCPAILSDVSSLPEVGGNAVLYVDPLKIASIEEALSQVATNPSIRDDLRQRAIDRARQFSPDQFSRGVIDVYHRVSRSSTTDPIHPAYETETPPYSE